MFKRVFTRIDSAGFLILATLLLASCGGGSGGGGDLITPKVSGTVNSTWQRGVYEDSNKLKDYCATPGNNEMQGSPLKEKLWLRSWSNEEYLWYREIQDRNPDGYSVLEYFELLKTEQKTPAGNDKDQFHFYYPTEIYELLNQGIDSGYGIEWFDEVIGSSLYLTVALVEPGSPADLQGVVRGDKLLSVDGISVRTAINAQATLDLLNEALFPSEHGASHSFRFRDAQGRNDRTLSIVSDEIATSAVFHTSVIETPTGSVGYMVFNTHNLVAQDELINAVNYFVEQNVSDLILDLRYNGGGYLAVASRLSYMIAGHLATKEKIFEQFAYNDKTRNPKPMEFEGKTSSFFGEYGDGVDLPSLDLDRVFVLTTGKTASASESIINGLRGIDIDVIQIGTTTRGKPFGFHPRANCGYTYFSISFQGENHKGFGDFADGFSPQNTTQNPGVKIEGCYVEEDFLHALGHEDEQLLARALHYRETGACDDYLYTPQGEFQKLQPQRRESPLKGKHPVHSAKIIW